MRTRTLVLVLYYSCVFRPLAFRENNKFNKYYQSQTGCRIDDTRVMYNLMSRLLQCTSRVRVRALWFQGTIRHDPLANVGAAHLRLPKQLCIVVVHVGRCGRNNIDDECLQRRQRVTSTMGCD